MTFLTRHRTICAVIEEIKSKTDDLDILALCDEAKDYAQRMSAKLVEYKNENAKYRSEQK